MTWWKPEIFDQKRGYLLERAALMRKIRQFFDENGFLEVETPALQVSPGMETHIHAFKTRYLARDLTPIGDFYLHTSPEFAMKKLLVAGLPQIYQICHVFRNAETGRLHSPEFTMLEWYRTGADYRTIMKDCENLLRTLGAPKLIHKGQECDPFAPWQYLTVAEAFRDYAGIDLAGVLEDTTGLRKAAEKAGIRTTDTDRWDDVFFAVMAEKIEPFLGMDVPCILHDYPVSMASLSRPIGNGFAERFELYVCGIELANAFTELTDAKQQRKNYEAEVKAKKEIYGEQYPVDEDFLAALEHGMPEAGGIALGIDRLIMLATGADTIDQILWTGSLSAKLSG